MKRKLLLISCLILLAEISYGKELVSSKNFGVKSSSIEFIENKGQFKYSDGKKAEEVLFVANTEFGRILVKKTGLAFVLRERINQPDDKKRKDRIHLNEQTSEKLEYKVSATEFLFDRANPVTKVETFEEADGYDNYYIGNESFTFVKSYRKLVLKGVYPKIDFVIYTGENKSLEYDFVVNPGADPKQIALKIVNFKETSIDANQNLLIKNDVGTIEHSQPKSFVREKNPANQIQSTFKLGTDNILRFDVPSYYPNEKLIIDPIIRVYGYGYGGNYDDIPEGIAVDSSGNTYTCGSTYSTDLEATANQFINNGNCDGFIIKIDANGKKEWSSYYGGSGEDIAYSITIDRTNMIVITGQAKYSKDLYTNVNQMQLRGISDFFISKLTAEGKLVWATFFGWEGYDIGLKVINDEQNNIIVYGLKADSIGTFESFDAALIKLTPNGNTIWSTVYSGKQREYGGSIALDKKGNIFIGAYTTSNDLPKARSSQYKGEEDGFIAKFNRDGVLQWTKYYGTLRQDWINSIATDDSGYVYVAGSSNHPGLQNAGSKELFHGEYVVYDVFVSKFTNDGDLVWGSYFGSVNYERGDDIALDKFGNVYVCGTALTNMDSDSLQWFGNELKKTVYWYGNAYLLMVSPEGNYVWHGYINSKLGTNGIALCVDSKQNMYLAGNARDCDLDITGGSLPQKTNASYQNTFIYKFSYPVLINTMPKVLCKNEYFQLNYLVNTTLDSNNVFIVQLSDSIGSFKKPIIIGKSEGNTSGTITALIHDSIPSGRNYKVRLLYSDSVYTREDWKQLTIKDKHELTLSGQMSVCKNDTGTYTFTSKVALDKSWKISAGRLLSNPESDSIKVLWDTIGNNKIIFTSRIKFSECYRYDTLEVIVHPLPEIIGDSAFSICINDAATKLDILKPEGGKYSGKGINNGFFYPDSAGVGINKIIYSYTNENGCKIIIEITAKVNPKPNTPKISTYADMIVSSEDEGNEWFVNDTLLEGVKGKRISGPKTGKYSARIRDTNGCVSDMSEYLDYISDVEENIHEEFSIKPNPAGDYVEIIVPGDNHTLKGVVDNVRIYDVFGEEVLNESKTMITNSKLTFNISNLSPGLYIMRIGTIFEKFIKY